MEIKDLKPNARNIDIVAEVLAKEDTRSFEKFGKSGRVCNAKLADDSGEVKLTLWNDEVDMVKTGDRIHIKNGWCSEYKGELQLSAGKFGKIEIVEKAKQVFTNDPGMLAPPAAGGEPDEGEEQVEEEDISDE